MQAHRLRDARINSPRRSRLAGDAGNSVQLDDRGDAVASKPAPTTAKQLRPRADAQLQVQILAMQAHRLRDARINSPCRSRLAGDAGNSVQLDDRGDAIASKPAPTTTKQLRPRADAQLQVQILAIQAHRLRDARINSPRRSRLAGDAGNSVQLDDRGDAIASKPAPTTAKQLRPRADAQLQVQILAIQAHRLRDARINSPCRSRLAGDAGN